MDRLTDDLLLKIFALVSFADRFKELRWVCKRWHNLLAVASEAWSSIEALGQI